MRVREMYSVEGKVAIVTGAARGLGEGYARGLAEAGAVVICAGHHMEGVEKTAESIKKAGGKAEAWFIDVSNAAAVNEAFQKIATKYGHVDILINNAGVEDVAPFLNVTEAQYDKIMGVNLKGTFFASQAAARIMKKQRSGKIVNIGSLGSAIGLAESSVYCGTKTGVMGLTRTMAIELARDNIQVNAIGPGYFRTQMTEPFFQDPVHKKWIEDRIPEGRIGTAEDLLGTVIFLCSSASDYVTGQMIYVDGGWLAS